MPHGGLRWTGLWLRAMWRAAVQLSLVRQSALSQVSWPANRAMAGTAAGPPFTLPLLPADVYAAFGVARPGPFSPEAPLRIAAQRSGGQRPNALRGSEV